MKGTACGASSVSIFTRSDSRSPTRPSCPCWPLPQVSSAPAAVTPAVWSAPAEGTPRGTAKRSCLNTIAGMTIAKQELWCPGLPQLQTGQSCKCKGGTAKRGKARSCPPTMRPAASRQLCTQMPARSAASACSPYPMRCAGSAPLASWPRRRTQASAAAQEPALWLVPVSVGAAPAVLRPAATSPRVLPPALPIQLALLPAHAAPAAARPSQPAGALAGSRAPHLDARVLPKAHHPAGVAVRAPRPHRSKFGQHAGVAVACGSGSGRAGGRRGGWGAQRLAGRALQRCARAGVAQAYPPQQACPAQPCPGAPVDSWTTRPASLGTCTSPGV